MALAGLALVAAVAIVAVPYSESMPALEATLSAPHYGRTDCSNTLVQLFGSPKFSLQKPAPVRPGARTVPATVLNNMQPFCKTGAGYRRDLFAVLVAAAIALVLLAWPVRRRVRRSAPADVAEPVAAATL
ncbi:MAG: hypothetical protein JWL73_3415 [Actinomycetia bacterium]|nr:hypothetical protein [Actinomycetes bacterium]